MDMVKGTSKCYWSPILRAIDLPRRCLAISFLRYLIWSGDWLRRLYSYSFRGRVNSYMFSTRYV